MKAADACPAVRQQSDQTPRQMRPSRPRKATDFGARHHSAVDWDTIEAYGLG